MWIRVQHVESIYNFHKEKNAEIVAPLENKPWGMAQYIIREINGYFLHFAGMMSEREKSTAELSKNITVIERLPTIKEYRNISAAVG